MGKVKKSDIEDELKKIKEDLVEKEQEETVDLTKGLSTGSSLLNLALTGTTDVGLIRGRYFFFVGDSNSGKSWISLTSLAEASINKNFDNYRLIYDDVEGGALMDMRRYFGQKLINRLESPEYSTIGKDDEKKIRAMLPPDLKKVDRNIAADWLEEHGHAEESESIRRKPMYSTTIESFYDHVDDAVKAGKPFIYILDSMDGLSSVDEIAKAKEQKTARRAGTKTSGSYGDGKAKANSRGIRTLITDLRQTESILLVISQTRDNIGFGAKFNPKTRSGGKALEFYATSQIWYGIKERIKRTVMGKPRKIGIVSKVEVKRNRITGREMVIEVPILFGHGIDDVGGMIRYMIEEGGWTGKDKTVDAPEFNYKGAIEKLIIKIEEEGQEGKLKEIVTAHWQKIEKACSTRRKNRYHEDDCPADELPTPVEEEVEETEIVEFEEETE